MTVGVDGSTMGVVGRYRYRTTEAFDAVRLLVIAVYTGASRARDADRTIRRKPFGHRQLTELIVAGTPDTPVHSQVVRVPGTGGYGGDGRQAVDQCRLVLEMP